ncbi:hypothetical protein WN48_02786 [Eufriesea mexicana]|uniref:Uncharacterized protein n=1 Tax=Eufriesea mexicana TaxID=516756 RepID=A0A310SB75_9HYME|nr:PREDICTED: uncharacterized protein C1orf131-like [Eufriesea mexicana]OAD56987.1 hypothetical protein WN48_02786 [Eufriesea mexicana]
MEDFIPTRVSKVKENAVKEFVSVNYQKPKKKKREIIESEENSDIRNFKFNITKDRRNCNNDDKKKQEAEMKRVRYEVMKFGMSGFKGEKAGEAEVEFAINLGAKPPRKKGINYKILKHKKKEGYKETQEKNTKLMSGSKNSLTKHKTKKTRKKGSDGLLGIYGKINKTTLGKNKK